MVNTYIAQNGFVAFEIEDAPPAGAWSAQTQYPNFTGSSYYRWTGPNLLQKPGSGLLKYNVKLDEPGTYYLAVRVRREFEGEFKRDDEDNDVFVRFNGGNWEKLLTGAEWGTWGWMRRFTKELSGPQSEEIELSTKFLNAGVNTIEFSGRSTDVMIDRVHLNKGSFNANANAPTSPTTNDPAPQPQPEPEPDPDPTPPPPPPPSNPDDVSFSDLNIFLVDTDTNQTITSLSDNATVDAAQLAGRNVGVLVEAKTASVESDIGSIILDLNDGEQTRTENVSPYTLFGDNNGDFFNGESFGPGQYDLDLVVYSGRNGGGSLLGNLDLDFTVSSDGGSTPPSGGGSTTDLAVIVGGVSQQGLDVGFNVFADGVDLGRKVLNTPEASYDDWNPNEDYERFEFVVQDGDLAEVIVDINGDGPGVDYFVQGIEVDGQFFSAFSDATFFPDTGGEENRIWFPKDGDLVFEFA